MHPRAALACLRGGTGCTLGCARWHSFSAHGLNYIQRNGRKTVLWWAASRAAQVYLQRCVYWARRRVCRLLMKVNKSCKTSVLQPSQVHFLVKQVFILPSGHISIVEGREKKVSNIYVTDASKIVRMHMHVHTHTQTNKQNNV